AGARRRRGTPGARCGAGRRSRRSTSDGSARAPAARSPGGPRPARRRAGGAPAGPAVRRPRWRGACAPSGLLALRRILGALLRRLVEQALQHGEAVVDDVVRVVRVVLHAEAALGAEAGAVLAAQRALVGLHREGVAHQRAEVHVIALEELGVLLLLGLDLLGVHEQLVESGGDVLVDGVQAAGALALEVRGDGAVGVDALDHRFELGLDGDVLPFGDLHGDAAGLPGRGGDGALDVAVRSGAADE